MFNHALCKYIYISTFITCKTKGVIYLKQLEENYVENNDIYVLTNDDEELKENDNRSKDYKSSKTSNFEKAFLRKLNIDQDIEASKGENINRSEIDGI